MTIYQIALTEARAVIARDFMSMTEAILFALVDLRLEASEFEIILVRQ